MARKFSREIREEECLVAVHGMQTPEISVYSDFYRELTRSHIAATK